MFIRSNKEIKKAVSQWKIEEGPRIKSLATYHLEYIAYALLDRSIAVNFSTDNNQTKAEINGRIFNITSILQSKPDFEQLTFNQLQLDAYCDLLQTGDLIEKRQDEYSHLHPAELHAITVWTGGSYHTWNELLRTFRENSCYYFSVNRLLAICVASHGLSKPLSSSSYCQSTGYRYEQSCSYLNERKQRSQNKLLVTNRGFTAFSADPRFQREGNIQSYFYQPVSLNPIGKDISKLSFSPTQQEIVCPPNTEFMYIKEKENLWITQPVRSANPIDEKEYIHPFSKTALEEIQLAKEKIRLNGLRNYIHKQITARTPKFLDGVHAHSYELNCLRVIASEINNPLSHQAISIKDINKIIHRIQQEVYKNKSIFPSSLNKIKNILSEALHVAEDIKEKLLDCATKNNSALKRRYVRGTTLINEDCELRPTKKIRQGY
jgi:hypothetical protein